MSQTKSSSRIRKKEARSRPGRQGEDFRTFLTAVRDHIHRTHRFPQVADMARVVGIPRRRCGEICGTLVGQRQLHIAFDGRNMPTIVVPYDMMQAVLRTQPRPDWIGNYEYDEKRRYVNEINQLEGKVGELEQFERLLYQTDVPLEEAVAYCLQWLGFHDVVHHKDDKDNPDITFSFDGKLALVEVQGALGPADKEKALQLLGWLTRAIGEGKKADELQAFLVVNHFRDTEPRDRGDPLTAHAREQLRLYNGRLITTVLLFEVAAKIRSGNLAKEAARQSLWGGVNLSPP